MEDRSEHSNVVIKVCLIRVELVENDGGFDQSVTFIFSGE